MSLQVSLSLNTPKLISCSSELLQQTIVWLIALYNMWWYKNKCTKLKWEVIRIFFLFEVTVENESGILFLILLNWLLYFSKPLRVLELTVTLRSWKSYNMTATNLIFQILHMWISDFYCTYHLYLQHACRQILRVESLLNIFILDHIGRMKTNYIALITV